MNRLAKLAEWRRSKPSGEMCGRLLQDDTLIDLAEAIPRQALNSARSEAFPAVRQANWSNLS